MKSRKAPGSDEVTIDILKAGGEPVIRWLLNLFTDLWKTQQMMKEWSVTILIKLDKNKGDKKICDNYRGIVLLNTTSKIFSRIILNRNQDLVDCQLLEIQSGFRSNRSTIDQIFTLKMIIEKRREFNKPLVMCFIDIHSKKKRSLENLNAFGNCVGNLWRFPKRYPVSTSVFKKYLLGLRRFGNR
jgi:hypothetical protein